MNKIFLSLLTIIPFIFLKKKNHNDYKIIGNNKLLINKVERYMNNDGKNKLSNMYFSIQVSIYLIYNLLFLQKYETEIIEFGSGNETFHLEFIKNDAYKKKNFDKIVFYSPGLVETKIDPIISSHINYFSSKGYSFCIFWKCGAIKKENNFHLIAKPENFMEALRQIISRGYLNVFLMGISAGSYNIFKYMTSQTIEENVRASIIIAGTLELNDNLNNMPEIWKKYFSHRLKSRANQSLNCPLFSKNDDLVTIINKINDLTDINLKHESEVEKRIVNKINVPCLFLNSIDDPIVKVFNNEHYPILDSDNFIRVDTKLGGHGLYMKLENWKFNFCLFSTNIANNFFENFIQS
ncbi:hypothetical protein CPAV1605_17 [seawater metagenome]|uniref:Alpha/beta hydrolase family n=1 Tax=seawater metagenome TaxID=1561972 RepID=A0A5E8CH02_9ZZZZ